jgi:hypothetical protein
MVVPREDVPRTDLLERTRGARERSASPNAFE